MTLEIENLNKHEIIFDAFLDVMDSNRNIIERMDKSGIINATERKKIEEEERRADEEIMHRKKEEEEEWRKIVIAKERIGDEWKKYNEERKNFEGRAAKEK